MLVAPETKVARLIKAISRAALLWAEKDLNLRRRKPAGLQPAPIGRSGTDPYVASAY